MIDFRGTLNTEILAAFGRPITADGVTMNAVIDYVDRFDDNKGVYYEAVEIEYPHAGAPEITNRTHFIIDSSHFIAIHQPRVADGWATVTARKDPTWS